MRESIVSVRTALFTSAVILAGVLLVPTSGRSQESEGEDPLPRSSEEFEGITPRASRLLREMSDYLKKTSEFTFHAEVAYDSVLDNGQKIQFGGLSKVTLRRPNRLRTEYRGDERRTQGVFDGRTFTIHDLVADVYAVAEMPPEIDAAVDHLFEHYGLSVPIADFVYSDPYEALTKSVYGGYWVGRHSVDGRPCHHLAFSQETIDWQIWIEDGPRPLPRKIVITYNDEQGWPQYTARFTHWNVRPHVSDHFFQFHAPEGAGRIDFLPVKKLEEESQ